ncbi:acyl-CoA thioesterase [Halobacteriales archaeon Cl-PHB]
MSSDEVPETARLSRSHTEMTEMIQPDDTNFLGRALGGVILHWMDIAAAISTMRFATTTCVTASMDHVDFKSALNAGDVATVQAYVFDTGRTSLEVKVDVHGEKPQTGESWDVASSFFTYVAIDEHGNTVQVPDLVCESEAERQHRDEAKRVHEEQLEALVTRLED